MGWVFTFPSWYQRNFRYYSWHFTVFYKGSSWDDSVEEFVSWRKNIMKIITLHFLFLTARKDGWQNSYVQRDTMSMALKAQRKIIFAITHRFEIHTGWMSYLKNNFENHIFTPKCLGSSQYLSFTASDGNITSSSHNWNWIISNMDFCYEQKAKYFIFLKYRTEWFESFYNAIQ